MPLMDSERISRFIWNSEGSHAIEDNLYVRIFNRSKMFDVQAIEVDVVYQSTWKREILYTDM